MIIKYIIAVILMLAAGSTSFAMEQEENFDHKKQLDLHKQFLKKQKSAVVQ